MEMLHKAFRAFFVWWENLTGLPRRAEYFKGKLIVNWLVISPIIIIVVLGALFLPSGLLDYWGVLHNE